MEIEARTVYEHDKYGPIIVLEVHRVYKTYNTDTDEGTLDSVVVRLAEEWDAYGPLWGHSRTEPLNAFLRDLGDSIDHISFTTP
jgi:hypothetical protein